MALLLVRHAIAQSRHKWMGDDRQRPLSKRGRAQADGLVTRLTSYRVGRVLTSPARRCAQTVEPLAQAWGVRLEAREELAEGMGRKAIELVAELRDGPLRNDQLRDGRLHDDASAVVVCSHGDVVPEVLEWVDEISSLSLPPDFPCAKGSTWALEVQGGRFVAASYVPPPA